MLGSDGSKSSAQFFCKISQVGYLYESTYDELWYAGAVDHIEPVRFEK